MNADDRDDTSRRRFDDLPSGRVIVDVTTTRDPTVSSASETVAESVDTDRATAGPPIDTSGRAESVVV